MPTDISLDDFLSKRHAIDDRRHFSASALVYVRCVREDRFDKLPQIASIG
jgi:hypothetical protein